MIILKPIVTAQTITIVPRVNDYDSLSIALTNESTNTTVLLSPSVTQLIGHLELTAIYNILEGTFYTIMVTLSADPEAIIYRGRVYCTAQTDLLKYTLNEGQYVEPTTNNNSYIII